MQKNARERNKTVSYNPSNTVPVLLTALMLNADSTKFRNYIGLPANKWAILIKQQKQSRKNSLSVTPRFLHFFLGLANTMQHLNFILSILRCLTNFASPCKLLLYLLTNEGNTLFFSLRAEFVIIKTCHAYSITKCCFNYNLTCFGALRLWICD